MDFNQVRFFLALANTLNFTRAAEHCYVTQPALTQAIKRLETELGGQLVRREGRNTELTRLGMAIRSQFEQIDRTRHLVRATVKAVVSGDVTEINIGLMCTIGPQKIAGMLNYFQTRHPTVSLVLHDVVPKDIDNLLLTGALDGAIYSRRGREKETLRYINLYKESMVVAFPRGHRFSEMNEVSLSEVASERYLDRLHCEFRPDFLKHCADEDLKLNVTFRSQREDWIQNLIYDGFGVSVLPEYSLLQPSLDHRSIKDPEISRQVEFVYVENPQLPSTLDMLVDHVENYLFPRRLSE